MELPSVLFEVTRRCNMRCAHCLRGDAEDLDMPAHVVEQAISGFDGIGNVTFTGGEPSLNLKPIKRFLEVCKDLRITVGSFYIATNGLSISEEFVLLCLQLYALCEEKEICAVEVSNDYFHADEGSYDTTLLDGLSFFRRKFEKEADDYSGGRYVISEGRGADIGGRKSVGSIIRNISTSDELRDTEIYVNVHGVVINGCDWSFDHQDANEDLVICQAPELADFVKRITESEDAE